MPARFYLLARSRHSHLSLRDWLCIAIATQNQELIASFERRTPTKEG